ncbi:hypothetical protein JL107_13995 [Nakamurella flavida]|uniref:CBS domain-containing protein n=1 Tax=Nakamurella flavida TaxID=363630 RepID=A0A938YMS5_9ACTN|nr:hypothetical protein [Nakamurella flavida]MBM9477558.1 hypothetical protein [Nakamurella flavida]MDP9779106.1 hypothetical protein [Nakamurella flavida]
MRTENALEARATDTIGPLRIRLLAAASAKQAVVVLGGDADAPAFHVFTVADVMGALAGLTGGTSLTEALDLSGRPPVAAVSLRTATDADVGRPVVENGRLLGVVAGEVLRAESTEDEMGRTMTPPASTPADTAAEPADKPRRRWGFLSRSGSRDD